MVHMAELKTHFQPEQLPLSLGGTFSHNDSSSAQVKPSSEDASQAELQRKPLRPPLTDGRRGSGSSSNPVSRSGSGSSLRPRKGSGGKTVNQLLEMFEAGGEQSATGLAHSSQTQPSQASGAPSHSSGPPSKPVPPPFSAKPNLRPTSHVPVRASPAPPPKRPGHDSSDNYLTTSGRVSQGVASSVDNSHHGNGNQKKLRRPILPSHGGRSANSSYVKQDAAGKETLDTSMKLDGGGKGGSGGSVVSAAVNKIKNQQDEEIKEKVPGKQAGPSKQALPTSSDQRKLQLGRNLSSETEIYSPKKKPLSFPSPSSNGGVVGSKDRPRAGSSGKSSHTAAKTAAKTAAITGAASAGVSPKRHKVLGDAARATPPQQQHKPSSPDESAYENVVSNQFSSSASSSVPAPSSDPPPPPAVPIPAILMRSEDMWRDSDVYENISIGFAGTGKNMSGPMPPLPPPKDLNDKKSGSQAYENIFLATPDSKAKKKTFEKSLSVEDDDDRLFGDEGPPGMQEEIIYENYGPDKGNRQMNLKDLDAYVEKMGKNGLATEYCRIRNEPISGPHRTCRSVALVRLGG